MGSLIKQFSVVGIISQVIWALLLFSSFGIERVMNDFGTVGPYFVGALALSSALGWLLMVAHLLGSTEIDRKALWFIAILFLPGQFIFWIKFILNSEEIDQMNDRQFDRDGFRQQYLGESVVQSPANQDAANVVEQTAVFIPAFTARKRGLTPPQFMSIQGQTKPSESANPHR